MLTRRRFLDLAWSLVVAGNDLLAAATFVMFLALGAGLPVSLPFPWVAGILACIVVMWRAASNSRAPYRGEEDARRLTF